MMSNKAMGLRLKTLLVLFLAAMLAVSGCSVLKSNKGSKTSASAVSAQPAQPKTVYMDFGDILLPKDLKVDEDDSFVFTTAGLTAGVLSLSGHVEANSLRTFFENRMPEDGWQMISKISSKRSMLLFKKQARWCVIGIEEGRMNTHTQIWVAPTLAQQPAGLTQ
jgi:uncharacterized protein YceK